jgi:hypothetical protein
MPSVFKSMVLGTGLLAGVAASAHAQSVSALPPTSPPSEQTARSPVYSSTQSVYPRPGGMEVLREEHYQPPANYDSNKSQHPYSTSIGPKPGSHSSGQDEHYQSTGDDAVPSRHPYTSNTGPKPGG